MPATLPVVGLADVDIKDHIKNSFPYVWIFSILCMIVAIILGIMLPYNEGFAVIMDRILL